MLATVSPVLADPVMHAFDCDPQPLGDFGYLVASVSYLSYCFNLEIFGIAFTANGQTPL